MGFKAIVLKCLLELSVGKPASYEWFADQVMQASHFTWPSPDQDVSKIIRRGAIARLVVYPLAGFGVLEYEQKDGTHAGYTSQYLAEIRLTSLGKGLLETL